MLIKLNKKGERLNTVEYGFTVSLFQDGRRHDHMQIWGKDYMSKGFNIQLN